MLLGENGDIRQRRESTESRVNDAFLPSSVFLGAQLTSRSTQRAAARTHRTVACASLRIVAGNGRRAPGLASTRSGSVPGVWRRGDSECRPHGESENSLREQRGHRASAGRPPLLSCLQRRWARGCACRIESEARAVRSVTEFVSTPAWRQSSKRANIRPQIASPLFLLGLSTNASSSCQWETSCRYWRSSTRRGSRIRSEIWSPSSAAARAGPGRTRGSAANAPRPFERGTWSTRTRPPSGSRRGVTRT